MLAVLALSLIVASTSETHVVKDELDGVSKLEVAGVMRW